jgi:hypothetical protein
MYKHGFAVYGLPCVSCKNEATKAEHPFVNFVYWENLQQQPTLW